MLTSLRGGVKVWIDTSRPIYLFHVSFYFCEQFSLTVSLFFSFFLFFVLFPIKAVRVTKPKIPESIRRNFELMWVCTIEVTSIDFVHGLVSVISSLNSCKTTWKAKYLQEPHFCLSLCVCLCVFVYVQGSRKDSFANNSSDSEGGGKGSWDWKEESHYW